MADPETTQVLDTGLLSQAVILSDDHEPPECEASLGKMTAAFPLLFFHTVARKLRGIYLM